MKISPEGAIDVSHGCLRHSVSEGGKPVDPGKHKSQAPKGRQIIFLRHMISCVISGQVVHSAGPSGLENVLLALYPRVAPLDYARDSTRG